MQRSSLTNTHKTSTPLVGRSAHGPSKRPATFSTPSPSGHKNAAAAPAGLLPCRSISSEAVESTIAQPSRSSPAVDASIEREAWPGVYESYWNWRGHTIRYLRSGNTGPPVLCVHGFGGNAGHWRKNLPVLGAEGCRAYAIDLLGYGYSSKPDPRGEEVNAIYNFENWGAQIRNFIEEVIGEPTLLTCNSVGGLAGLQAAIDDASLIPAVQVMNISLRMLHLEKQAAWQRPLVAALQRTLRTTALGSAFFSQVATRDGVRSVLKQCYHNSDAVDDELVDVILNPGLEPGAVDVFLDFISYSGGPLPETLLKASPVPVSVLWGEKDPWEKIEWGREFAKYPTVEEFVSLPDTGHCPQDENPGLVNPLIMEWVRRHAGAQMA